jgi:nitrite reductase/ring-hydroxylating ferredoxin subunit
MLLGEVPLLIVADGETFYMLADRCSHMSGPLSDGDLSGDCVTCPWHGSIFRLSDGSVARGPATAPQPVFDTPTRDGVQVYACQTRDKPSGRRPSWSPRPSPGMPASRFAGVLDRLPGSRQA